MQGQTCTSTCTNHIDIIQVTIRTLLIMSTQRKSKEGMLIPVLATTFHEGIAGSIPVRGTKTVLATYLIYQSSS